MFLLDTNVISELRKSRTGRCNAGVQRWVEEVAPESLFLSVISVLELEQGILQLGRRDPGAAAILHRWLHAQVLPEFAGRLLEIDAETALRCAALHVPESRPPYDALIAATALAHNLTVVTRNTADFEPTGVRVLNPFD